MIAMVAPDGGEPAGLAARFAGLVSSAWGFFASYETMEPVVRFGLPGNVQGAAADPEDLPGALLDFVNTYMDAPHTGWLNLTATPFQSDEFECRVALEGLDGPLRLAFTDGTELTFALPTPVTRPPSRWATAVEAGFAQQHMESVVACAQLLELRTLVQDDDRLVLDALLHLLGEMAKAQRPPKSVVKSAASWLWHKVDTFIEEAARAGGKAAGVAGVGVAGYQINKHFPQIADHLRHLVELSSS
ncbi:hypothetical protein E6P97_02505 [Patescibacteria group bacterium]|nr:MAG: hypothetical protein E6P97_02505 [Patescibacteria group bacterium]